MLKRIYIVAVGACLLCSLGASAAKNGPTVPPVAKEDATFDITKPIEPGQEDNLKYLSAPPYQQQVEAFTQFVETTKDTTATGDARKATVILTLGEMRAAWSVRVMLANLMFVPKFDPRVFTYREQQENYPAAIALVQIGSPAVESVVERLTQSPSKAERDLCVWVLDQIEGRELCLAHLTMLKGKQSSDAKIRLEEAIQAVQHLNPERNLAVLPKIQPEPKATID